jgi:hypothetical protein
LPVPCTDALHWETLPAGIDEGVQVTEMLVIEEMPIGD